MPDETGPDEREMMDGTITANEAAYLIQRLAEALAEGKKHITVRTDEHQNVWVNDRCSCTIRDER